MNRNFLVVVVAGGLTCGAICDRLQAAVSVFWDGSAGISSNPTLPTGVRRWEEGNWTRNDIPGQTANAAIGQDGNTGGRGGVDIVIGAGDLVYHDHNDEEWVAGALGTFNPRMDLFGPGSLTISNGSTLWLDSHSDDHGIQTRVGMPINLDGGTLRRTRTPAYCPPEVCSVSGGVLSLGDDLLPNTRIDITLTNAGRIENDGKVVFGSLGAPSYSDVFWEEDDDPSTGHNPGIQVIMTINDGTLDLTGGNAYDDLFGRVNGELIFDYEKIGPNTSGASQGPKGETYAINFTGPGSIIVDTGIFVVIQSSEGFIEPPPAVPDLYTSLTYQDLWDLGILQANGLSGMTGATFGQYFDTTGAPDDFENDNSNYTLTSLVPAPGQPGDHNEDDVANAADYVAWRKLPNMFGGDPGGYNTWYENFGEGAGGQPGDYNDDGRWDAADYVVWRKGLATGDYATWYTHFGESAGAGASSGNIPEPTSLVLIVAAGMILSGRRFRR